MLTTGIDSVQTQNKLIPWHCSVFDTEPSASASQHFLEQHKEETSIRRRKQRNSQFDMLISFTSHLGSWVWWSRKGTETGLIMRGAGARAQVCFFFFFFLPLLSDGGNRDSPSTITGCFYCCLGHMKKSNRLSPFHVTSRATLSAILQQALA